MREPRDSRMEEISFLFVILFEFVCIKDGIIRSLEELLMEEVTQSRGLMSMLCLLQYGQAGHHSVHILIETEMVR